MALWGQTDRYLTILHCVLCAKVLFAGWQRLVLMPQWGGVVTAGWPECNTEAVEPVKLGSKNAVWGINSMFVISSIVSKFV